MHSKPSLPYCSHFERAPLHCNHVTGALTWIGRALDLLLTCGFDMLCTQWPCTSACWEVPYHPCCHSCQCLSWISQCRLLVGPALDIWLSWGGKRAADIGTWRESRIHRSITSKCFNFQANYVSLFINTNDIQHLELSGPTAGMVKRA